MSKDDEQRTLLTEIRSQLDVPTMIVGSAVVLNEKFSSTLSELLQGEQLKFCGELPENDTTSELWHRVATCRPERLWIVGGDGTINLVGQCALRPPHPLQYWLTPAGTANDLARALSDRVHLERSGDVPLHTYISRPIDVDLLSVRLDNNPWIKCTANMFTLGTSARNTHHVTDEIKERWGALAYLTQIWRSMSDLEPFSIQLSAGQSEIRCVENVLNLFVANGGYCGGGFKVAPSAAVDDGLMDVIIVRQGTTTELARLATSYLTGSHIDHPLVEHFTTARLVIECQDSSALTMDGEPHSASHIEITVTPRRMPISLVLPN